MLASEKLEGEIERGLCVGEILLNMGRACVLNVVPSNCPLISCLGGGGFFFYFFLRA